MHTKQTSYLCSIVVLLFITAGSIFPSVIDGFAGALSFFFKPNQPSYFVGSVNPEQGFSTTPTINQTIPSISLLINSGERTNQSLQ